MTLEILYILSVHSREKLLFGIWSKETTSRQTCKECSFDRTSIWTRPLKKKNITAV